MSKVLVTGSTGFIGRRIVFSLLEQGHEIYALTRLKGTVLTIPDNSLFHTIYGDVSEPKQMETFPEDIDAAFYLIHSLGDVGADLIESEKKIAQNFLNALKNTRCKQIIYLAGIIEDAATLSPHLQSRLEVEKVLKTSHIPCTIIRSSIIIGEGSASFEIIRDLVEKLSIMVAPIWVHSLCQPISISDVLYYLNAVLLNPVCYNQTYDIGGPEAISFKNVLLRYAAYRKLQRYILDVPVLSPRLSSYWLVLITSVKFSICKHLVESMKQNTRKLNLAIDSVIPHDCLPFEDSLNLAFQKIAQNEVVSTWMNAWNIATPTRDISQFIAVPEKGCLKDSKSFSITIPVEEVQRRIWSIGGANGWYSMNWAWKLRGLFDQLVGGTGLNRGRTHQSMIQVGDSIDFWRVILADAEKKHLILYAQMKLPGEAWLEFQISENGKLLNPTATFRPKGFWGLIYWYTMSPFHLIIFRNLGKTLAQKEKI